MVDRDSGQRTRALVTALWRAAWIWRWFVQPAIVWCRGARPRTPPHRHPPTLLAHSGGGGRRAGVWWWDHGQFWGSDVRHGVVPVLWRRDQEGEDTGVDENRGGHGTQGTKKSGDARAMQARSKGVTPAMCGGPRGPYPSIHTEQELTSGGKGGGRRRTMRLCSLTNYCAGQGWLIRTRYRRGGKQAK